MAKIYRYHLSWPIAVAVATAFGKRFGDNRFDKSLAGYGYLMMTGSAKSLVINFYKVTTKARLFDTVTIG